MSTKTNITSVKTHTGLHNIHNTLSLFPSYKRILKQSLFVSLSLWFNPEELWWEKQSELNASPGHTSLQNQQMPACQPELHMHQCAWGGGTLSPKPVWPLPWGYISTMQCLLNPVLEQLSEWVWREADFPHSSNWGVKLMFALLSLTLPFSLHWLWMEVNNHN